MIEGGFGRDSELSLETVNSTQSSMSSDSICSTSFSRLSFDLVPTSPESLSLKPHRSSDFAYSAILSATFRRKTGLTFHDFHLLRRVGAGDIGTVYLCRLRNSDDFCGVGEDDDPCFYAMKVVDKEAVALKKKIHRAEMERKILKMLDHPFLPTIYAEFEASNFSCIVMEFCSGGDLHSLRHKQPHKRFSLTASRFYAAEVLVALEYLHMLGIIYRDLKPENVLVRSDGHIMLSDFDLSLCSDAIPAVESPDSSPDPAFPPALSYTRTPSISSPFSCLSNRVFRSKKIQTVQPNRLFVAEPVGARSCSFVGTHEYVSPEVASGRSHGNAVDWWSFGIFIYEMIYGRTPFAGPSNEATLRNIIKKPLTFPTATPSSTLEHSARDLISGLLNKNPTQRLGSKRGAADIKKHPFFKGINLALVRMLTPPEVPGLKLRKQKTTPLCPIKGSTTSSRQSTASFDCF
ncbi:hypothetical protein L6164_037270 [Bauhinia variegata]|uniref:Uncharacterized protein n=1 Tax=Bauhinia variegata TaxID=167791 RepID=A0ACB9KJP1_BAUVA|nr:hypothetical protein L6164_037270 [Bauhinia variegata]